MDLKSKNLKFEAQRSSNQYFGACLAECVDPAEALELVIYRFILARFAPWRGAADSIVYAHSTVPKSLNCGVVGCGCGVGVFLAAWVQRGLKKQAERMMF